MNNAETPRQMSYRLIIGDYSTETKVAELNRLLDRLAAYEQGPDDAEVKKIEDLYKRGQYVCEECVEPCEHTPVFFLLDALRAERAKVVETERAWEIRSKDCARLKAEEIRLTARLQEEREASRVLFERAESAESRVRELQAKVEQEHDLALRWRRENMELAARNVELKSRLKSQGEALAERNVKLSRLVAKLLPMKEQRRK